MTKLLINNHTRSELNNFAQDPGHAVLLAGPEGSGKLALAKDLAAELLAANRLVEGSSFKMVEPDEKDVISIGQIRKLKRFTELKNPFDQSVIIIAKADRMTVQAQNSLLKLLEEPPDSTIIILTAPNGMLKPTVVSRLQQVVIRSVSIPEIISFYGTKGYSKGDIELACQITGGRIGQISRLLADGDNNPIKQSLAEARSFLSSNRYERLIHVAGLSQDKDASYRMMGVLEQMATEALKLADNQADIRRWQRMLTSSYQAEAALDAKVNTKLVLVKLALNL